MEKQSALLDCDIFTIFAYILNTVFKMFNRLIVSVKGFCLIFYIPSLFYEEGIINLGNHGIP